MKKYFAKSFLILAVLFSANPIYAYDFCEVNENGVMIYYNVISEKNKTCEVTSKESHDAWGRDYYYDDYAGDVNIPSSANGYQVIRIGSHSFGSCQDVTSVTIPNTVTSIGSTSFYWCTGMTSINFPNSINSIESLAFTGCSGLTSIDIPNSMTTISSSVFEHCTGLTSVIIPDNITTIGSWAFASCENITSLTIGNSVATIQQLAFQGCKSLTSLTIPKSVSSMVYNSFSACINLTSIVVEAGNAYYNSQNNCNAVIETSTNTLLFGCKNTIIPNTVTRIEQYAFSGRNGLTSMNIPNSVQSIGIHAFYGCI